MDFKAENKSQTRRGKKQIDSGCLSSREIGTEPGQPRMLYVGEKLATDVRKRLELPVSVKVKGTNRRGNESIPQLGKYVEESENCSGDKEDEKED